MPNTADIERPLAHSGGHLLATHLHKVAELAREFAQALGTAGASMDWAYLAGLWHDGGVNRLDIQCNIVLFGEAIQKTPSYAQ